VTLDRDGVPIRCEATGSGPHVTLIHGVGSNLESWDAIAPSLGERFRVLRYDLRGHGRSGKPPGPYALGDFVDDLRARPRLLPGGRSGRGAQPPSRCSQPMTPAPV
jgi:pimeloyl-ACP methyl ester carboxylesterase